MIYQESLQKRKENNNLLNMNENFNAKYDSFIEQMGGLAKVERIIKMPRKLIRNKYKIDQNFNNIPLNIWDGWAEITGKYDKFGPIKLGNVHNWPKGLSASERVCILKRAAERISQIDDIYYTL